jgi:hypothetical protein
MATVTILLAQIWGPIILAIGLGFFISRGFYTKLYKDIQNEPLATLTMGIFLMVIGIIHVSLHSIWGSVTEGFISFLGWATLLKGAAFLIAPRFVDKAADWEVAKKLLPAIGIVMLIVGIYLVKIGYFA